MVCRQRPSCFSRSGQNDESCGTAIVPASPFVLASFPVPPFSAEPEDKTSDFVGASVGEARLVFDFDYNHPDCKFFHNAEAVARREEIAEGTLRNVMRKNAARLYKIIV